MAGCRPRSTGRDGVWRDEFAARPAASLQGKAQTQGHRQGGAFGKIFSNFSAKLRHIFIESASNADQASNLRFSALC